MLFIEQKDFVWGLIASMYLGNVVSLIVVLATVPLFAAILRIPFSIIAPVIIVVCAIGAYTVNSAVSDVGLMLVFGVLGYFFKKLDYPIAPMVLAMVLGDRAEEAFRQSLLLSRGDLSIFWSSPISATLVVLSALLIVLPLLARLRDRLRGRNEGVPMKESNEKPVVALTLGDPAGIGPELIARLLARPADRRGRQRRAGRRSMAVGRRAADRGPACGCDPVPTLAEVRGRSDTSRAAFLAVDTVQRRPRCSAGVARPPAAPRCWRC